MSIESNALLKQLKSRKIKLEVAIKQLSENSREAQKNLSKAQNQLLNIEKELATIKNHAPYISEHAILRYVERVLKIDIEAIRVELLLCKQTSDTYGNGKYPISDGHYMVIKGTDIVSII